MWCFNYIAGKIALRHMDILSLVSLRFEVAAIVMVLVFLFRRPRPRIRSSDLWTFAYLGFFGVLMNQGLFTVGLNYTTTQHSVIIISFGPVVVLLLAAALGLESLTAAKIIGMAISFLGVIVLEAERSGPALSPSRTGDLITLAGICGYSAYVVLAKRVAQQYDAITMITFNILAAAIMISPLAIRQALRLNWGSVGWAGWGGMLYMAIFSSIFAYTGFYWLLQHMDASRVAAVNYFQPLIVIVLASVILGERTSEHLVAGGILVLLGVYLAERNIDLSGLWRRRKAA